MKLAEVLILRADCKKKIDQLRPRLVNSAKVQEGDEPPEDPQELMAEVEASLQELASLIKRINKTNSLTEFQEGMTLTDALAERDVLALKLIVYNDLVQATSTVVNRYSRSEIKLVSTVNSGEVQKQLDRLSRQYRELDTKIQEKNWQTDLIEE